MLAMHTFGEQGERGQDEMFLYRMLFLFHLLHSAVFEGPLDNVGLGGHTLDVFTLFNL